jgi:hypothetical protein
MPATTGPATQSNARLQLVVSGRSCRRRPVVVEGPAILQRSSAGAAHYGGVVPVLLHTISRCRWLYARREHERVLSQLVTDVMCREALRDARSLFWGIRVRMWLRRGDPPRIPYLQPAPGLSRERRDRSSRPWRRSCALPHLTRHERWYHTARVRIYNLLHA